MKSIVRTCYGVITTMAVFLSPLGAALAAPLGQFEDHGDVGPVKLAGSASYDAEHERYTISAAGTNMWDTKDEFHLAWKRMKGDFLINARVKFVGTGSIAHRKIGVIVRKSLESDSPYVDIAVHGDGLTSLQVRRAAGEVTTQTMAPIANANVLQLERKGNKYSMRVAWD